KHNVGTSRSCDTNSRSNATSGARSMAAAISTTSARALTSTIHLSARFAPNRDLMTTNSFASKAHITVGSQRFTVYRLDALVAAKVGNVATLPYSLRILLENLLRYEDGKTVTPADVAAVAGWNPKHRVEHEVQLRPARVLMQDFTGVPAVCDLAAMRDAFVKLGKPGKSINPLPPADLVIDHSVQVDEYATPTAFGKNVELEYRRNRERYLFLKWGQHAFANMKVVPPGTGICHQVNLEYLAKVVFVGEGGVAYPDS